MSRTALYRHFGKSGELLYVGISLSAVYRLSQHMESSCWASSISTVKIEYFETREAACAAERSAILAEKPKHNVVYNTANDNRYGARVKRESARVACADMHFEEIVLFLYKSISARDGGVDKQSLGKLLSQAGFKCRGGELSDALMKLISENSIRPASRGNTYECVPDKKRNRRY